MPFRGLQSYLESEHDLFLGRQKEKEELIKLVCGAHFRAGLLFGEEGVGKSSLLLAGFIPALRTQGFVPLFCSNHHFPLESLAKALTAETGQSPQEESTVEFLVRVIGKSTQTFVFIFDDIELQMSHTHQTVQSVAELFTKVAPRSSGRCRFLFSCASRRVHLFDALEKRTGSLFPPSSRIKISRMQAPDALHVLHQIFNHAGLSLEEAMAQSIVQELARTGDVLPADLQIAALTLHQEGITNIDALERLGGFDELIYRWIHQAAEAGGHPSTAMRALAKLSELSPGHTLNLEELAALASIEPALCKQSLKHLKSSGIVKEVYVGQENPGREDSGQEEIRYSLAHQVLSPRILEIAAPVKLRARRASELLGNRAAQEKRLSAKEYLDLRKQGIVPSSPQEIAVLDRTKRLGKRLLLGMIAIPLLIVALAYATMSGRYYLDTAQGESNIPTVVVRAGSPFWSWLHWLPKSPAFGSVIADSGLSQSMVTPQNWKQAQALDLRGNIQGKAYAQQSQALLAPQWKELITYITTGDQKSLSELQQMSEQNTNSMYQLARTLSPNPDKKQKQKHEKPTQALQENSPKVSIGKLVMQTLAKATGKKSTKILQLKQAELMLSQAFERMPKQAGQESLILINNPQIPHSLQIHLLNLLLSTATYSDRLLPALETLWKKEEENLRAAVLPLLAQIQPAQTKERMIQMEAQESAPSDAIKAAMALAWGQIAKAKTPDTEMAKTALTRYVKNSQRKIRTSAAQAYGFVGDSAQELLIKMVDKEFIDVAAGAAQGLANGVKVGANAKRAIAGLQSMWARKGRLKRMAAKAYADIASVKPGPVFSYMVESATSKDDTSLHAIGIHGLCNALGAQYLKAGKALAKINSNPDIAMRTKALHCVIDNDQSALASQQVAIAMSEDPEESIRILSAQVLLSLIQKANNSVPIQKTLETMLQDSSSDVRAIVYQSLSLYQEAIPEKVIQEMTPLFKKAGNAEKRALLQLTNRIKNQELVELGMTDQDPFVRISALGTSIATNANLSKNFQLLLSDSNVIVRKAALQQLAEAKHALSAEERSRALEIAILDKETEISDKALGIFATFAQPSELKNRLQPLLDSRSEAQRTRGARACLGLATQNPTLTRELLEPLLADSSHDVRTAMLAPLAKAYASSLSPEELYSMIGDTESSASRRLVLAAAFLLKAQSEPKQVQEQLQLLTQDGPPFVQSIAELSLLLLEKTEDGLSFLALLMP